MAQQQNAPNGQEEETKDGQVQLVPMQTQGQPVQIQVQSKPVSKNQQEEKKKEKKKEEEEEEVVTLADLVQRQQANDNKE